MNYKYKLEDRPPWRENLLYGLQWLALIIPPLLIMGQVVTGLHQLGADEQILYLQKLLLVSGILLLIQVLFGHGMPLIIGPATVLLVGILASQGSTVSSIYSAIFIGGLLLSILAFSGLLNNLQSLFTPRVVIVILVLIAFTITPTIINLLTVDLGSIPAFHNIIFALIFSLLIFAADKYLSGIWKATLVVWIIIAGTVIYSLIFPGAAPQLDSTGNHPWFSLIDLSVNLSFDPAVILSFLFCFLALSINDLGSIQSLGSILDLDDIKKRTQRGIGITGVGNMIAGLLGVIGSVNYSGSPGIIATTGCASRYTLIPAGLGLILLSFSPLLISLVSNIPPVIIGIILLYLMALQIAAALALLKDKNAISSFNSGIIIGFPLLTALLIAFLPPQAVNSIPAMLRPILGNGFVIGVINVIILEHFILREPQ
jgi:xanthine/uracil permease